MTIELLIYALRAGDTDRYKEQLISTNCLTLEDVEKVKAAASIDGLHSFRVANFIPGKLPDFSRTVDRLK